MTLGDLSRVLSKSSSAPIQEVRRPGDDPIRGRCVAVSWLNDRCVLEPEPWLIAIVAVDVRAADLDQAVASVVASVVGVSGHVCGTSGNVLDAVGIPIAVSIILPALLFKYGVRRGRLGADVAGDLVRKVVAIAAEGVAQGCPPFSPLTTPFSSRTSRP